jgi:hypothetical protein
MAIAPEGNRDTRVAAESIPRERDHRNFQLATSRTAGLGARRRTPPLKPPDPYADRAVVARAESWTWHRWSSVRTRRVVRPRDLCKGRRTPPVLPVESCRRTDQTTKAGPSSASMKPRAQHIARRTDPCRLPWRQRTNAASVRVTEAMMLCVRRSRLWALAIIRQHPFGVTRRPDE